MLEKTYPLTSKDIFVRACASPVPSCTADCLRVLIDRESIPILYQAVLQAFSQDLRLGFGV